MKVKCKMMPGCEDLVPRRAHADDAGLDLYAAEDAIIFPSTVHEHWGHVVFTRAKIRTGVCVAIPYGWEGQGRPRSGRGSKGEVAVLGTVDAGYRGELFVTIENRTNETLTIKRGDRIAQLVIAPVWTGELDVVGELDETERGEGGFGSTGR